MYERTFSIEHEIRFHASGIGPNLPVLNAADVQLSHTDYSSIYLDTPEFGLATLGISLAACTTGRQPDDVTLIYKETISTLGGVRHALEVKERMTRAQFLAVLGRALDSVAVARCARHVPPSALIPALVVFQRRDLEQTRLDDGHMLQVTSDSVRFAFPDAPRRGIAAHFCEAETNDWDAVCAAGLEGVAGRLTELLSASPTVEPKYAIGRRLLQGHAAPA